jgi:hypothetical protein
VYSGRASTRGIVQKFVLFIQNNAGSAFASLSGILAPFINWALLFYQAQQ